MKKFIWIAMVALCMFSFAGCGGGETDLEDPIDSPDGANTDGGDT